MRNLVNELSDNFGGISPAADLDEFRRALKLVGQGFDFFGERGREHQRLPLPRECIDDFADVRKKAHVQHAVGFIKDQELQRREISEALAHQIEQSTGSGDDDFEAFFQGHGLRPLPDAAKTVAI